MTEQNTPDSFAQEEELKRERNKKRFRRTILSTVFMLISAVAAALLVANFWLPVFEIYGKSMNPTLWEGDVVVSVKDSTIEQGDIIAFYHGNKLVIKRCIAVEGDVVNINSDGTIEVNDVPLEEPYITEHHDGGFDVEMPYQVPAARYFVLGDNRELSVDSRHTAMGCISDDQLVGRVVLRVWPIDRFGWVP